MAIVEPILPAILLPVIGYFCVHLRLLDIKDMDGLSDIMLKLLIPALLFINTATAKIPAGIGIEFLAAYYIPVFIVFCLAYLLSRHLLKSDTKKGSVFAIGASYTNATIIGLPITLYGLGEAALVPLFVIVSIHNLTLFFVGMVFAELNTTSINTLFKKLQSSLRRFLLYPITLSLILGGLVNLSGIQLPFFIHAPIDIISQAAIPAALLVLGASFKKYKIQGAILPAMTMAMFKLIALPILVAFFSFFVFDIVFLWAATAVLVSAMPMAINSYVFAKKYETYENAVSSGIIISTFFALITIPVVLYMIKTYFSEL